MQKVSDEKYLCKMAYFKLWLRPSDGINLVQAVAYFTSPNAATSVGWVQGVPITVQR